MDPRLDLVDDVVAGPGQELDDVAPGGSDALVRAHQHPQGAGGGDLFALHKVHGQVVGDLPGEQADGAHIGLLQADVFDDGESARAAHGGPHVQLALVLFHQLHVGILHIAPHVALVVGHGQHRAQGAAALDLEGEGAPLLLQHVPHHRDPQQGSAQGGGGHGQQGVDIPGPLHQVPARDGHGLDIAVRRHCSYDFICH